MEVVRHVKATLDLPISAEKLGSSLNELGLTVEDAEKPLGVRVVKGKLVIQFPAPEIKERKPRKAKKEAAA